jgi:hypothetical protein
MGHSSPTTTAGYDRRGHRTRVDAIGRLHMPWTPQFQACGEISRADQLALPGPTLVLNLSK